MEMFDGTIVTTSAPKMIAHALNVSVGRISPVIIADMITLAVLIWPERLDGGSLRR